jgi:hypothetical protein
MAVRKVITEDLGKIAEKALCDIIGTPYNMKFKYPQERVDKLAPRFAPLKAELAGFKHTGSTDDLHDFTSSDNTRYLSVKTTKKGWKICPQEVGQPARSTFCPKFALALDATNDIIKNHILTNYIKMMPIYLNCTFHCDLLFFCEKTNICQMITMKTPPDWTNCQLTFSHIEKSKPWNESTTLYGTKDGKKNTIGEFQIHNHRDCIKFRFDLKGLLDCFPESFNVRLV